MFDFSSLTSAGTTAGSFEGAGSFRLGSRTLTVGGNGLSTNVTGVIADGGAGGGTGGALVKTGAGTMILSGINTYTGATTVDGGTLAVNGSITASSGVTVNDGGTLAGIGTVGNTTVNSGGTLASGDGTAGSSMNVNGSLAFQSGAFYMVQLNPATSSSHQCDGRGDAGRIDGQGGLCQWQLPREAVHHPDRRQRQRHVRRGGRDQPAVECPCDAEP